MIQRTSLRAVRFAALTLTATGLWASTASADFNLYPYSMKGGCSGAVDPITFVFYGATAYTGRADNHLKFQTKWNDTSGGPQSRSSHGYCAQQSYQRANHGSVESRYHARIFSTHHLDAKQRYESGLTPHNEDFVWTCVSHAVKANGSRGSGFDQGRRYLHDKFYGSHHAYGDTVNWGNTRNFRQCDGRVAGSNGVVHWFAINGSGAH